MITSCDSARPASTLLLGRGEVRKLLSLGECITAVETALRAHAEGRTLPPGLLSVPAERGGFHVKAAGLKLSRTWFAVKCNGNFFDNRRRFGMPNIQGLVILCDGDNGYPLAVIDSIEITILRTGAATAAAARRLSRPDSRIAAIIGCGNQGRVQLRALKEVRPIDRAQVFDIDSESARQYAEEMALQTGIEVRIAADPAEAVRGSDVCVTCTPSRSPFLSPDLLPAGLFLAAVGADSHDKQELDPAVLASSKVVVDSLEQCAVIGEVHHALAAGAITRESVHAGLADVVIGRRPGRVSPDEVIVFDSTGTALQDVAAAVAVYDKAQRAGAGRSLDLLK